jgi:hypothetical protein
VATALGSAVRGSAPSTVADKTKKLMPIAAKADRLIANV